MPDVRFDCTQECMLGIIRDPPVFIQYYVWFFHFTHCLVISDPATPTRPLNSLFPPVSPPDMLLPLSQLLPISLIVSVVFIPAQFH